MARVYVFAALAIVLAVVFVRLGFWQLRRLRERRARNAVVATRLSRTPVPVEQLADSDATYRRVIVTGTPDYDHEFVLIGRSHSGSPGVNIVTPVRMADGRAVLLDRGWVYAPDAATVDLTKWREARTTFTGYLDTLHASAAPSDSGRARKLRVLSVPGAHALVPYAVNGSYVVVSDSAASDAPVRIAAPSLDDGPHLSYAIQWFAFATIAVVGAAIVVVRSRRDDAREPPARGLL